MEDKAAEEKPNASDEVDPADSAAAVADTEGETTPPESGEGVESGSPDEAVPAPEAPSDETSVTSEAEQPDVEAADDPSGLQFEPVTVPDFTANGGAEETMLQSIDMLSDVNLRVRIELGRTRMYVEDVLRLGPGSVVELDKLAGDPVDVFVNDRLVARGEVLVLNENFCVRVSEVISDDNERVANERFS
jgi:flagellar motor switch protein FliN/FliY